MMGRYRTSKINNVVSQCTTGIIDDDEINATSDGADSGNARRDSFSGGSPNNNKSPNKSNYQALFDDDDASESSGESMGIRIPQGYLSTTMSSNSLDFSSSNPNSSPKSKKRRAASSSALSSSKYNMKKNEGNTLFRSRSGSFSPRTEPNEEDLRRLVALAKHPNPEAAERAIASSSSNTALESRRRRSSSSSSGARKRNTSRNIGSSDDGSKGTSVSSSSNQSDESTTVNTGAWCFMEEDSGSSSTGDESNMSGSPATITTFAANLGSRKPSHTDVRTTTTATTYGTEEDEDDYKNSMPSVTWEDQRNNDSFEVERAPPPLPSSQGGRRRGGVLEWMSVLFTPASGQAESVLNTTDSSLASKDQHSLGISVSSEKTPKISNLSPTNWDNDDHDLETGDVVGGEGGGQNFKKIFARKSTVVIAVLSVILVVAVATTIAAALYSSGRRDGNDNGSIPISSFTMIPRPPTYTTAPSVIQPTASPSASLPTTNPPIMDPATPTSSPNVAPNPTLAPTKKPTSRPTSPPTVAIPAPVALTSIPTRKPTGNPSKKPTERPTAKPSTRPPTSSPTKGPEPTPAPFKSFFEANLVPVGESLEGSEPGERYGYSVAVSDDGKIMAVGAPYATVEGNIRAGIVQVYELQSDSSWVTRGPALYGRNTDDQFGSAVVLSSDGQILVVSEPTYDGPNGDRSGNVRAFLFSPMNRYDPMGQEIFGQAATDHFGVSLTLSGNGQRLAVGAPYHDNGGTSRNVSGNVRIFQFNQQTNEWDPLGSALEGSSHLDWFGWGVDMSYDGSVLAVGAPRNLENGGYVRCFKLVEVANGSTYEWQRLGSRDILNQIAPTRYDDSFGHVVALSSTTTRDNSETFRLAIGSPGKNAGALNSGLAAVYELQNNEWKLVGSAVGPTTPGAGHQFGYSVDLQNDILAVGTPGAEDNLGEVSLYQLSTTVDGESWQLHPTIDPTQLRGVDKSDFGFAVQLVSSDNDSWTVAVGSAVTSSGGGDFSGRVNVFQVV